MMPFIHHAFLFGCTALVLFAAWKVAQGFDLRAPAVALRDRLGFGAVAMPVARRPAARSSGNSAFDEWRDGEIAHLDGERDKLEAQLHAFEGFVDRLRRAKDRETFDRFKSSFHEIPHASAAPMATAREHDPA